MATDDATTPPAAPPAAQPGDKEPATPPATDRPREYGGPAGLEPTRYGDWERKGRCVDF
ncbi:MAG: DUF1674 domain-containing protein [Proteobacteria bacterium]|nr:DUF1674 domain-containing protein [Pseudomonadota bacterium]MBK8959569.1 DUF1674 domain-containing protein [Pseudomonadota bacterium]